jgi:exodeoxyribonuclease VII large subunit
MSCALHSIALRGGDKRSWVIIGRGGGSREDLWAFNDERVARAVAACPVPTISAVGHEVDMSLCDLVADLRAATPSAAAEAAATSHEAIVLSMKSLCRRLVQSANQRLYEPKARAASAAHSIAAATTQHLQSRHSRLGALAGRLQALSPLATLERGYAIARRCRRTHARIGERLQGQAEVHAAAARRRGGRRRRYEARYTEHEQ